MKTPVPLIQDFVNRIERGAGHTTCAIVGAKATGATLVVAGAEWAAELRHDGLKVATWRQVMAGEVHGPLIIDPGVLQDLVGVTHEHPAAMPRDLVDAKRFPLLAAWVGPSYVQPTEPPDEEGLAILFRRAQPHRTVVEFVADGGLTRLEEVDGAHRTADWVGVSTSAGSARFPKGRDYPLIVRLFNHDGDEIWNASRWT